MEETRSKNFVSERRWFGRANGLDVNHVHGRDYSSRWYECLSYSCAVDVELMGCSCRMPPS